MHTKYKIEDRKTLNEVEEFAYMCDNLSNTQETFLDILFWKNKDIE